MLLVAATLGVYLFVTAPPPLAAAGEVRTISIRTVFSILQQENDAAREMWTQEIVSHGKAAGLAFQESWREPSVEAGPLPALFLRETAQHLERRSLQLGLFLGSPFPINPANRFTGIQADRFAAIAAGGPPQFFYEPTIQRQTAMFADRAVVEACVSCHNAHADSPKVDWKLHAIMGAATWMYPDDAVTAERALELVGALRTSIRAAYTGYLDKVATFRTRPKIGDRWPKQGFYLPSADVFMRELERRTSASTLRALVAPDLAAPATAAPAAQLALAAARPPAPEPPPPDPALVIRSNKAVRVTIDQPGSPFVVAKLPPGGTTSLSPKAPFRIGVSDPDGVQIEYDGKLVELPGASQRGTEEVVVTVGDPTPEKS